MALLGRNKYLPVHAGILQCIHARHGACWHMVDRVYAQPQPSRSDDVTPSAYIYQGGTYIVA